MPNFRYRALAENGKIVSGLITAPSLTEVARRIDYLRLVPIDTIIESRLDRRSISNSAREFARKTLRFLHSILRYCLRLARGWNARSNCYRTIGHRSIAFDSSSRPIQYSGR